MIRNQPFLAEYIGVANSKSNQISSSKEANNFKKKLNLNIENINNLNLKNVKKNNLNFI